LLSAPKFNAKRVKISIENSLFENVPKFIIPTSFDLSFNINFI